MQRTAKWTGDYQVHSYEIGPDGHVRIQKVCNYLQDAAGCHARELGVSVDQLLPKGLTWVLSKLRLHMVRLPKWGEVIRIMTWPADVQRLFAIRDFRLFDENERDIGQATTSWLLLDVARKRPVRLPAEILKFHPDMPQRVLTTIQKPIPAVERIDLEKIFQVRYSDLDLNRHVNNVSYLEWALETIPEKLDHDAWIYEFEIEFLAETVLGDEVIAQTQWVEQKSGEVLHRLQRRQDQCELVRARSCWTADVATTIDTM